MSRRPISLTPGVPVPIAKRKVIKDADGNKLVPWPWTVLIDSREQQKYGFDGLWSGPAGKSPKLIVNTAVATLPVGDYSLAEYPRVIIERKSKEDLYNSVNQKRDNFEARLYRMCAEYDFAAVVVEASWDDLLSNPPKYTQFNPKSLGRTIQAWMTKYRFVQWVCMPDRAWAEAYTFRLLEKFAQYQLAIADGNCEKVAWEMDYDCMMEFTPEQLEKCNDE